MALTFADLKTEVQNRGFQYLEDSRVGRFVNDAIQEINEADDWIWLQGTASGPAPLSITDLDTVETVYDSTNQRTLVKSDQASLIDRFGDITLSGTPQFYYVTSGAVNVFSVASVELSVRYFKVATDLVSASDQPLIPDRYRYAVVEYACAKAYLDSDNPQMMQVCRSEGDRVVDRMRESQVDYQQFIVTSGDC